MLKLFVFVVSMYVFSDFDSTAGFRVKTSDVKSTVRHCKHDLVLAGKTRKRKSMLRSACFPFRSMLVCDYVLKAIVYTLSDSDPAT